MPLKTERIAIFAASLRIGGVQKFVVNLSAEFARRGYPVDVVLARAQGPLLEQLHPEVRVINLNSPRILISLLPLVRYLRRENPSALLTLQTHCNVIGVIAAKLAFRPLRLILSEHNALATRISSTLSKEAILLRLIAFFYRKSQGIVAVSSDLAGELSGLLGQERGRIQVIYNPVVTEELVTMAEEPLDHPWFVTGQPPVISNVGRLVPQKDQATLLRAFARLRQHREARLLIIGDGPERKHLEDLAVQLGISSDFSLPGFDTNPYRFMRRCQVFVLSSAWEGFGNVLVEAMACGTPVVATDCHSGPAEILGQGRYGLLVPVGDDAALASAIEQMLVSPTPAEILRERASLFNAVHCADQYLELLLPNSV